MGDGQVDANEQLRRWISIVTKEATSADAKQVKQGIDALMNGTETLVGVLQSRYDAMSKQARSKPAPKPRIVPPKLKPAKPIKPIKKNEKADGGERQKRNIASMSSSAAKTPTELALKQQLLNKTYAGPSSQLSLQKAAKALTR